MNGKGDSYRPVDQKRWDENYERIYGKKRKVMDGCDLLNPPKKVIRLPKKLLPHR